MVSVLHKKQEYKVEKLKYKKVGGHAAEDQNQIRTSKWQINHPGSSFTVVIDKYSLSFISDELLGEVRRLNREGDLLTFLSWKGGGGF